MLIGKPTDSVVVMGLAGICPQEIQSPGVFIRDKNSHHLKS
jgi:hypothetical protein